MYANVPPVLSYWKISIKKINIYKKFNQSEIGIYFISYGISTGPTAVRLYGTCTSLLYLCFYVCTSKNYFHKQFFSPRTIKVIANFSSSIILSLVEQEESRSCGNLTSKDMLLFILKTGFLFEKLKSLFFFFVIFVILQHPTCFWHHWHNDLDPLSNFCFIHSKWARRVITFNSIHSYDNKNRISPYSNNWKNTNKVPELNSMIFFEKDTNTAIDEDLKNIRLRTNKDSPLFQNKAPEDEDSIPSNTIFPKIIL